MIIVTNVIAIIKSFAIDSRKFIRIIIITRVSIYAFLFTSHEKGRLNVIFRCV